MKIEQIYTGCLAQGAYYITSNGYAAIIDPLRDIQPYLDRLKRDNVTLKYIFETHFHADFVSGHIDLSNKTGASIVYGETAKPDFDAVIAKDSQEFQLGDVRIKVMHTPGHTLESSCFLLIDENNKEKALFSGDTLFLGDVGRPDLAQKAANMTQEQLAALLYESLYTKILPLPDDVLVYPAHGAGSACGKNMMKQTVDTLGNQKKINYALNQPDCASFVKAVTDGLLDPPAYFGMNVSMNKSGYSAFDYILMQGMKSLSAEEFESNILRSNAIILDSRSSKDFARGFISNSINIGLDGDFAPWVGAIIKDVEQPLLIIAEKGRVIETITRLARVGFDNVVGYLEGGITSWKDASKEIATVPRISSSSFASEFFNNEDKIIDIRKNSEYQTEHIENASNLPLSNINEWIDNIDSSEHFYIHCAGGYRSMIAASILLNRGITKFSEIEGGFNSIAKTKIPITVHVCPSTLN